MTTPIATARRQILLAAALATLSTRIHAQASSPPWSPKQRFPDVVSVQVRTTAPDVFDFDVTVSSPYDTPSRYADGFRVTTPDGKLLGERPLLHDHQHEQPFTRDLHAVKIPGSVTEVVVQARDQKHGYGGKTVKTRLPGR